MAYGDKLFEDGVEHIESHAGEALCGYPKSGFLVDRKPGLAVCHSCELIYIYERYRDMLESWIVGSGIKEQPPAEPPAYTPGKSGLFKRRDGTEFDERKR